MAATEIWKPVVGFEGFYEVSNMGDVRSLPRSCNCKGGGKVMRGGQVLKATTHPTGYKRVTLSVANVHHDVLVQYLVLEAFVGERPYKYDASHLNGCRDDNRIENLLWESHSENMARTIQHGTSSTGFKNGNSKLSEENVMFIQKNKDHISGRKMAKLLGVHRDTIHRFLRGETYSTGLSLSIV